ncbi:MAG: thiamine-phosphate kinase, partial [Selenomonadales bacterium]|nr:thiamine-phosphate kinase [Selenomonadales bacterium]
YSKAEQALIKAHVKPCPQVVLAKSLAEYATSMNDVSDGLASESNELAKAGNICIRIDKAKIPLSDALQEVSLDKDKVDYALYGGEDYQLIFTMPPQEVQELIDGKITVIGEVIAGETGVFLADGDKTERLLPKGYQHF